MNCMDCKTNDCINCKKVEDLRKSAPDISINQYRDKPPEYKQRIWLFKLYKRYMLYKLANTRKK